MAFFRFIVITISSTEEPADGNMPAAFFPQVREIRNILNREIIG